MNNTYEIKKIEYLEKEDFILVVIQVSDLSRAKCYLNEKEYDELLNKCEPYDFKTHIFLFPKDELSRLKKFNLVLTSHLKGNNAPIRELVIDYDEALIVPNELTFTRPNRGIKVVETINKTLSTGAMYILEKCETSKGWPVLYHILKISLKNCDIVVSTTKLMENNLTKGQTVLEQAELMQENHSVIAATNADFFDIEDTGLPSGLCIKEGKIIANPNFNRPFFGITKQGLPIISTPDKVDLKNIKEAVGGMQFLVRDASVADIAPIQPFGERPHPRTAVGITKDNDIIIMIVDGREKEYSNGASLVELSEAMIRHGAQIALNLDGGGSSTLIINENQKLVMVNRPAKLITQEKNEPRPVYNALIVKLKQ
ncbi:MAG: phosphodiester glycosidase family protein [Clostridia bacterium]|nr:phosphodiester glycosidase family protein [Clostridia bacterium]